MYRIGIIGFGRMGITHAAILGGLGDVMVEGIVEPSNFMRGWIRKYMPRLAIYESAEDMFTRSSLDAVIVATPPTLHLACLKASATRGVPAFVEKPFTVSFDQAEQATRLFREGALLGQVGYVYRCYDTMAAAREIIKLDLIGRIVSFRGEITSATVVRTRDATGWRSDPTQGGGALMEMGVHIIDLAQFLVGKISRVAGARFGRFFSENVEDYATAALQTETGAVGVIEVNWSDQSARKPIVKLKLLGTEGSLVVDTHTVSIFRNSDAENEFGFRKGWNSHQATDVAQPVPFYVRGNAFTRQLMQFITRLGGSSPDPSVSTFSDAMHVQKVVYKIRELAD
jgi:predicted dehydrogenase